MEAQRETLGRALVPTAKAILWCGFAVLVAIIAVRDYRLQSMRAAEASSAERMAERAHESALTRAGARALAEEIVSAYFRELDRRAALPRRDASSELE